MPFQRKKPALILKENEKEKLKKLACSRAETVSRARRASILLGYAAGEAVNAIAKELKITRPTVDLCVDKALAGGVEVALQDLRGRGRRAEIDDGDRAWLTGVACQKPKDLGYAAETWTLKQLAKHARERCAAEGHPALARCCKSMVHEILKKSEVKSHKVTCYLERRDPQFEEKVAQVLSVYKEVHIVNERELGGVRDRGWCAVSCDEKPGIQAVENAAPDLPPVPGELPTTDRDYEYRRHGTVSLLAGIDLHDGSVLGLVRDGHRSLEFTEFLSLLDSRYRPGWRVKVVLDNHSAHISKETVGWLKERPGRFEFVFTPKHGSWLNLVEMFFSKMAGAFLRHIRVKSKDELKRRIEQYLAEVNADPVVFKWEYKLDEVNV